MKTVRFDLMTVGGYACECGEKFCCTNHSGEYVAVEKVRKLVEALKFYIEEDECKYGPTNGIPEYCDDSEACRWCKAQQALNELEE